MAKISTVMRQKKRERLVKLKWEKRQELKAIIKDLTKGDEERLAAQITLNKMPRDSSYVRLRNRCQLTGRPRGCLRKFKLSRICLREFVSRGIIPGVVKASW